MSKEFYLKRAEAARQAAAEAKLVDIRERFLKVAAHWQMLADHARRLVPEAPEARH
jgi:hypothetical protein